jgi:hypothetical protein
MNVPTARSFLFTFNRSLYLLQNFTISPVGVPSEEVALLGAFVVFSLIAQGFVNIMTLNLNLI